VNEAMLQDVLVFLGLMIATGCFTGIVVTLIRRRSPKLQSGDVSARLAEISERLARLETSVDATALEVERISEGQRFTTRLLASKEQPDTAR